MNSALRDSVPTVISKREYTKGYFAGLLVASFSAISLMGCAASLLVYDEDGNLKKGVPVRTPILVEITEKTIYKVDPSIPTSDPNYETIVELCEPTLKQSTSFLPLGEISYIEYDPATFAKSEFSIDFGESGALKSISVNSDPAATTESVSNLLATVLPFIKAPRVAPTVDVDLEELRNKSCIVKAAVIESIRPRSLD